MSPKRPYIISCLPKFGIILCNVRVYTGADIVRYCSDADLIFGGQGQFIQVLHSIAVQCRTVGSGGKGVGGTASLHFADQLALFKPGGRFMPASLLIPSPTPTLRPSYGPVVVVISVVIISQSSPIHPVPKQNRATTKSEYTYSYIVMPYLLHIKVHRMAEFLGLSHFQLKFIYSEKATIFEEISLDLMLLSNVKAKREIS